MPFDMQPGDLEALNTIADTYSDALESLESVEAQLDRARRELVERGLFPCIEATTAFASLMTLQADVLKALQQCRVVLDHHDADNATPPKE